MQRISGSSGRWRKGLLTLALLGIAGAGKAELTSAARDVQSVSGWDSVVVSLPLGTQVRITNLAGRRLMGVLEGATPEVLLVRVEQRTERLQRSDVARIERLAGRAVGGRAKRGFLIGAVVGVAIGTFAVESNRGVWIPALSLGWGAVGAAVGAIEGAGGRDYVVVYEAPPGAESRPRAIGAMGGT